MPNRGVGGLTRSENLRKIDQVGRSDIYLFVGNIAFSDPITILVSTRVLLVNKVKSAIRLSTLTLN